MVVDCVWVGDDIVVWNVVFVYVEVDVVVFDVGIDFFEWIFVE